MDVSFDSISLVDFLIRLLADHVPKEAAFHQAQHLHAKESTRFGLVVKGDPPVWKSTPWETAVRWLAQRSTYFHSIEPIDVSGWEPIDTYEHLLRDYLSAVKEGGPTQSNAAAAELFSCEQQGLTIELYGRLKPILPPELAKKIHLEVSAIAAAADLCIQGESSTQRLSLDAQALAVFIEHPTWNKTEIAKHLNRNSRSLAPKRCPKLAAAIAAHKAPHLPRGSKDAIGNIEAWDER